MKHKNKQRTVKSALSRQSAAHKAAQKKTARLITKKKNTARRGSRSGAAAPAAAKNRPAIERGLRFTGSVYHLRGNGGISGIRPESIRLPFDVRAEGMAEDGDKVEAVLTRVPRAGEDGRAKILSVFGKSGTLKADYEAILSLSGIRRTFPSDVTEEGERVAAQPVSAEGREDLRDRLILTIDGAGAKDLDDAVSLEKTEDGWTLGVHIADVSHYVTEGSALDREAMDRGTSVYFADQVVPMLPVSLSNGACSLDAGTDKYALSAHIRLDKKGRLLGVRLSKSILRSSVRGVYEEVNDLFLRGKRSRFYGKYEPVYAMLKDMKKVYLLRASYAVSRGCVELQSSDCEIRLDRDGMPIEILRRERGVAEKLIEQFMLLANEAVARYLSERKCPCVYRIHEAPDEEKKAAFILLCHNYGIDATGLSRVGDSTAIYADILEKAREKGVADIVSDAMLRSFQKARYAAVRSPHFGLALDYYCHFTSPIRRYPDLSVHRILSAWLRDGTGAAGRYASFARVSALRSSENELRALEAERAILDLYKTVYLRSHEGEEAEGRISSVQPFGFFVMLDNTCEGLVPAASLPEYVVYHAQNGTLTSKKHRYALGDRVKIRIVYADISRHRTEFSLLPKEPETSDTDAGTDEETSPVFSTPDGQ